MKKEIIILTDDNYIVFIDRLNEDKILAFTKTELKRKQEITYQFEREENVPEEFTIPVYELHQVKHFGGNRFGFDITDFRTHELPINRIKWLFIKSGQ